jgi:hypothetical protein
LGLHYDFENWLEKLAPHAPIEHVFGFFLFIDK